MNSAGLLGGRYEVRDVLGFGATAEVCDGWDTHLSRPVAIKLLRRGLSSQAAVRQRFQIEARAAAALNHPNIVRVYDIGNHHETPYIVMERLPGTTLGDQIALGPLPQAQARAALLSVLAALAVAHDAGMLHRDIKPGNLLLTQSGTVKVADFGIVKTAASVHTTTGHIVGTLAYMSPDRVSGKPASVDDDLYAVGVVGYEALTGRKPFPQEDIMPLALAIIEGRPPPVKELRPDIDPSLADVIERAMSPDPLRRFGSADAMRRALNGEKIALVSPVPALAHSQSPRMLRISRLQSPPAVTAVSPASVKRSPRRALEVVGSAVLLGAMALAVLAFTSNSSSTTPATAPGTFSVSTPGPSPIGLTEVPRSTAPTVPAAPVPVVVLAEVEQASPTRTVEKAMPRELRDTINNFIGAGSGNSDNGNGFGNVRRGNDNGNIDGARRVGDTKGGTGNANGNNGHVNGNRGNGNPK
ncbi:serine/threonine-protein kinase [Mycobacterium sp. ITM-2016-00318]|uniref:serine/threonine-protein kinase n=1 Tax=Mycobacterium sp. ITM-2016-00318 TaxID=2099693 RepID=UPI000CFA2D7C|nr:serine/threonine-protein kinase [Mycobacterium sp. ITM-2016-00318]WNG90635.1 serine/threonine-protein kinase [Mycobacterium sp. ITM-2016-00318]